MFIFWFLFKILTLLISTWVLISAKIVKLSPNIAQTPLIFGAKRTLAAAPISLIKRVMNLQM
jgi:hypothetical protein